MMLLKKLVFIGTRELKYPARLRLLFHGIKKKIRLIREIRKITNISAPSVINVTLTNACNHDCKTCTYRVSNRINLNVEFLPYEAIKKIVDEVAPFGVNFVFVGGGTNVASPTWQNNFLC